MKCKHCRPLIPTPSFPGFPNTILFRKLTCSARSQNFLRCNQQSSCSSARLALIVKLDPTLLTFLSLGTIDPPALQPGLKAPEDNFTSLLPGSYATSTAKQPSRASDHKQISLLRQDQRGQMSAKTSSELSAACHSGINSSFSNTDFPPILGNHSQFHHSSRLANHFIATQTN